MRSSSLKILMCVLRLLHYYLTSTTCFFLWNRFSPEILCPEISKWELHLPQQSMVFTCWTKSWTKDTIKGKKTSKNNLTRHPSEPSGFWIFGICQVCVRRFEKFNRSWPGLSVLGQQNDINPNMFHQLWLVNLPPSLRFMKGNQWVFISPDHKASYFLGSGGYVKGGWPGWPAS